MLRARLEEAGEQELADRVTAALENLDPIMLELPAYEREPQDQPSRENRGRRRRGMNR